MNMDIKEDFSNPFDVNLSKEVLLNRINKGDCAFVVPNETPLEWKDINNEKKYQIVESIKKASFIYDTDNNLDSIDFSMGKDNCLATQDKWGSVATVMFMDDTKFFILYNL